MEQKNQYMFRDKMKAFDAPQKVKDLGYYPYFRSIESEQDTVVKINGKDVLMFGSNSYLGLTNHPRLKEASKKAIDKYGSGCAGSRFLNGTLDIHLELEDKIARFVNKDASIVFSTGYQVNLGVLSALPGRHDYLILDDLDHACIYDGARLSFARMMRYSHNDMDSLEKVLQSLPDDVIKIVVTDGVFSMEGDIAKLPDIVALSRKYGANIMVDDAHGLGVLGKQGKGTCNYFGLTDEVELIMGTFSKSLASIGGFIAADFDTINYLKHLSRSLVFSASIAPSNAASVIAAIDIIEEEPERIEKLWANTNYAKKLLTDSGFNTGRSETPIIPVFVGDEIKTFMLTKMLQDEGVFINPVINPAVPKGDEMIRFSLMATHSFDQIDQAINKIVKVSKQLQII
jgi:8-amino-7-oxononanoate synthase